MLISLFVPILVILGMLIGGAIRSTWLGAGVGAAAAGGVSLVLVLLGLFDGDNIILNMTGAKEIRHDDEPRLWNVVEEMSIAAGVPRPKLYLIKDGSPNAFATGRDPGHATVAVTRGLLDKLNRDELQGVIAHEMSHVRNYDIRFAMVMAILVGAVVLVRDSFLRGVFEEGTSGGGSDDGKEGCAGRLVLLALAIVGAILAPILARIIQLAVSRQREYLADASAAELTRYPQALAQALEKISADRDRLDIANRATQHLYIVNPVMRLRKRTGASIWDTHPPIDERIRRLREMK
jgi:heat shock protein HtpX